MRRGLTRRQYVAGATVTALGTTVGLAGCLGGDDGVPDASFTFSLEGTELTVTHDGGDELTEDNTGAVQIVETDNQQFLGSWELPVAEGDSVTVRGRLESGNTVVVRWFTVDEEELATLDSYEVE